MKHGLIIISLILLMGCQPFRNPQFYVAAPEDAWIVDCAVAPPPDKDRFMTENDTGKLYMMATSYNNQTKAITDCNIRLQNIRNWKAKELSKTHK